MDAFEQLRQERELLQYRLSQIEEVLAEHAALQRKVVGLLRGEQEPIVPMRPSAPKPSDSDESVGRRVTADVAAFERAVREILSFASTPLDRGELYRICVERGISIGGKDPLNTLASRMSRMTGVTNIRGKGYILEERLVNVVPTSASTMPSSPHFLGNISSDVRSSGTSSTSTNLSDILS